MDGIQAVLPCKSVNEDGKYKILVKKDRYHETRECLMNKLSKWINNNAAPDAEDTLIKYPSPPEVAPISSDGFSRREHSYMRIDINTAFSVGSAITDSSPPEFVFQDTSKSTSLDDSTLGSLRSNLSGYTRTWADTAAGRNTTAAEHLNIGPTNIDKLSIIRDLESSRAEVETLKFIVAQVEAERVPSIRERWQTQFRNKYQRRFKTR
jgi:hypothetical protein